LLRLHRRSDLPFARFLYQGPPVYRLSVRPLNKPQRSRHEHEILMPKFWPAFCFRGLLISNTLILASFGPLRDHRAPHTGLVIVCRALCYGMFSSLQYTTYTLTYADISEEQTSNASSIASTMQQMSISFGVATRGWPPCISFLLTFIPPAGNDSRHPPCAPCSSAVHHVVHDHLPQMKSVTAAV